MKETLFSHDHFNTWQLCKNRYYFKYIKKLNWPDLQSDYELGQNFHALVDYFLRGFNIAPLFEQANQDVKNCWNLIKNHNILSKNVIKTEWGFNSRVKDTENWLIGRIDAVFYDPEVDKYIIADWKTGKYVPKNIDANFQHKIYLYSLYKSQKDLKLCIKPEQLEFQYIKILDEVSINKIEFSSEKLEDYEQKFLEIINSINKTICFINTDDCPLKQCSYKNLCFNHRHD